MFCIFSVFRKKSPAGQGCRHGSLEESGSMSNYFIRKPKALSVAEQARVSYLCSSSFVRFYVGKQLFAFYLFIQTVEPIIFFSVRLCRRSSKNCTENPQMLNKY